MYYQERYGFWVPSRYEDVAPATKDHETYLPSKGTSLGPGQYPDSPQSRTALDVLADRMAEFDIERTELRRVNMTNVMGYSHVPVHVNGG